MTGRVKTIVCTLILMVSGIVIGAAVENWTAESASTPVVALTGHAQQDLAAESGNSDVPVWAKNNSLRPMISCDEDTFQFDRTRAEGTLSHSFKICNRGQSPLYIRDVYSTCGCTVIKSYSETVAPNLETQLDVELDTSRLKPDEDQKFIVVRSNDPNRSELILKLVATVAKPK